MLCQFVLHGGSTNRTRRPTLGPLGIYGFDFLQGPFTGRLILHSYAVPPWDSLTQVGVDAFDKVRQSLSTFRVPHKNVVEERGSLSSAVCRGKMVVKSLAGVSAEAGSSLIIVKQFDHSTRERFVIPAGGQVATLSIRNDLGTATRVGGDAWYAIADGLNQRPA